MLQRLFHSLRQKLRDRRTRRVRKQMAARREKVSAVAARLVLMEWRDAGRIFDGSESVESRWSSSEDVMVVEGVRER